MNVRIDEARENVFTGRIDDFSTVGGKIRTDRRDCLVFGVNVGDKIVAGSDDPSVFD